MGLLLSALMGLHLVFSLLLAVPGTLLLVLSIGTGLEVGEGYLVIYYGYPRPVLKILVQDLTEVVDVQALRGVRVARYFRLITGVLTALALYPLVLFSVQGWCVVGGRILTVPYVLPPLLTLYTFIVVLVLWFVVRAESFEKFLCRLLLAAAILLPNLNFVVGYCSRHYGLTPMWDLRFDLSFVGGEVLLVLVLGLFLYLARARRVLLLRDSESRCYVVLARDLCAARSLIDTVVRRVMCTAQAHS